MNTPLLPTSYLAPIQFFVSLVKHNKHYLETQENYSKQTYRNRCEIYGANGKLALSIPVCKNKSSHTKIKDIKINYADRWQKIHWKSLESSYRRSPYFEYYEHEFEKFYSTDKHKFLFDYNLELFNIICKLLDIETDIQFTTEYIKTVDSNFLDLRNIDPKKSKSESLNYGRYIQVFEDKKGFLPNLSIVDLLFNEGPNSKSYLLNQN